MPRLSKCSFCPHGLTDDIGSTCGAEDVLNDPQTKPIVRRTIETDCKDSERRFGERSSLPVMMVFA
jgi:hypothetical protein